MIAVETTITKCKYCGEEGITIRRYAELGSWYTDHRCPPETDFTAVEKD